MKLAFIFDTKFTRYNGNFYSVNLSEELWKTRYLQVFDEVVVIGRYIDVKENPTNRLVLSNNDRVQFRCIKNTSPFKRILNRGKESRFIKDAIKDCDAVICRSFYGVKECRELGKNYMMEVISCLWDIMWNHGPLGWCAAIPYYISQRMAVKNSPYVVYVTKEFLQKRYPNKRMNIGLSDVALPIENDAAVLENRMCHITNHIGKIVIGTAAAVNVRYKGHRYVIKALARLKKKGHTNYIYQMVGKGDQSELRGYAEKHGVADQVEFLGAMPHEEVFEWLDALDIYLQPSFTEGLSRAVVEAMSRGLPCIVSDAGGNPELIESAYVCSRRINFSKKLANAILTMDKEKMSACAERNYNFTKEFDPVELNQKRIRFMKMFAEKRDNI